MERLVSRLARISLNPIDVAVACREAGLAFLETDQWSKRDLAQWLIDSYQFATLRGHGGGVFPQHHGTVSREKVLDLVERVRDEVRNTLDHVLTGDMSFARQLVEEGVVAPFRQQNGQTMYVAMNHKSLRLADRVLSLFAADFLMRPHDYRARLSVCEYCKTVSFTGECRHPQSGIFLRDGREISEEIACTVIFDEAIEDANAFADLLDRVEDDEPTEINGSDIIVISSLAS
jgi:hypothetical protein